MNPRSLLCATLVFLVCSLSLKAQTLTWADDIAPLIYDNCSGCHHDGGIAPFELMSYNHVVAFSSLIYHVIDHRIMPPWPADPNYRHFAYETYLEDDEILAIHNWIDDGMPEGDPMAAPDPPEFLPSGSLLNSIDLSIQIPPYTLQSNFDEYRWFVFELNNSLDTFYINRIETIAGSEEVVHHADVYLDFSGQSILLDQMDPLSGFNGNTGTPNLDKYINAWQPGGMLAEMPDGWGMAVPPGAHMVMEIHYGPGGWGLTDTTRVNFEFVDNPNQVREVDVGWILYDSPPVLLDGPLVIPPNQISTFHQRSAPIGQDLSLIAICPHMHYLGNSYKVWATTPQMDTIPLIDIPHWDFHWQKYYYFQKIQKLPAGSILHSVGTYDNTVNNHDNPNNPPITVFRGPRTTDEMFLTYFIFADYQPGDEHIIQDPDLLVTSIQDVGESVELILFPNPVHDILSLQGELDQPEQLQFRILDTKGTRIKEWQTGFPSRKVNERIDLETLPSGIYFVEWTSRSGKGAATFLKE